MSHHISLLDDLLTLRLSERGDAQAIQAELRTILGRQQEPITIIVDLTNADVFDQALKASFFRVLQHSMIERVGICGLHARIGKDVRDMVEALQRVRAVDVKRTEHELLAEYGLSDPPTHPHRLAGLLSYLKREQPQSQ